MIDFVDLMDGRAICFHINEFEMEKFWYSDQWILEPTLIGRRIQCLIDENGEIKFWGKRIKYVKPNLDNKINHILNNLKQLNFPKNTLIDGYFSFGNSQSLLTQFFQYNSIEMSDKLQEKNGKIVYYITDIVYKDGKDLTELPLFDRKKIILTLAHDDLEYVKIQKTYFKSKQQVFKQLKDKYEVFIFKNVDSQYEPKISAQWKIFKEPETFFMVLTDFIDGKTENRQNMITAFEGSQFKNGVMQKIMNIPVNNCDDMVYYYNNKEKFLGKIFEIKAFERLVNKYQEARFHKMRPDLTEEVCIFDTSETHETKEE